MDQNNDIQQSIEVLERSYELGYISEDVLIKALSKHGYGKRYKEIIVNRDGKLHKRLTVVGNTRHDIPRLLKVENGYQVKWNGTTHQVGDFVKSNIHNIDYLIIHDGTNLQARKMVYYPDIKKYKYKGEVGYIEDFKKPKAPVIDEIKLKERFVKEIKDDKDKENVIGNEIQMKLNSLKATNYILDHANQHIKFIGMDDEGKEHQLGIYSVTDKGKLEEVIEKGKRLVDVKLYDIDKCIKDNEIDIEKAETGKDYGTGKHEDQVKVQHNGKTFYRKQVVGRNNSQRNEDDKKDTDNQSEKPKDYSVEELQKFAKESSENDLQRAIKEHGNENMRKVAHEELDRRSKEEHIQEDDKVDEKQDKDKLKGDSESTKKHSLIDILDKSQLSYSVKTSYKNGSIYYEIAGSSYRVSDHSKPIGTFGSDRFKEGENDFRNHDDLFKKLKEKYDLNDKSKDEQEYKNNARQLIEKNK